MQSEISVETLSDGFTTQENALELDGKFLTFWTEKQLFGVPIVDVVQIVGMQEITHIPDMPHYAKGIINLRGSIIPIIDVRIRFGKQEKEYDERTCIIVTNINEVLMGFVVDAVDEVTDIEKDMISDPPIVSGDKKSAYLTGVAKLENKVVLIINTAKLLGENEFNKLSQAAQGGN